MHGLHPYTAQEARVDMLRAKAEIWRTVSGMVLILIVSFALSLGISGALASFVPLDELALGSTPLTLLTLLFSFVSVIIGVEVTTRTLQKRSLADVIGPLTLARAQFAKTIGYLFILMLALMLLPPYAMEQPLEANLAPVAWLMLLPLSIGALLVQTGAEEILFRGYLQQSLAARFRSPLVFLIVPSIIFALGHYVPAQSGENAWIVAIWAGVFGILMADLTARAGTLGPAIAIHFFNNFTAIVIVAPASSMNGLALYHLPFDLSDTAASRPWLAVDFAMLFVCWLVGRLAIRR